LGVTIRLEIDNVKRDWRRRNRSCRRWRWRKAAPGPSRAG